MIWLWVLIGVVVVVFLPKYVKLLSASAYRGRVEAMRKIFKSKEKGEEK